MKHPHVYLIRNLLKNNGIKINEEELEFQLLSHPTFPSLHAITGVLDHFSVKNYALEVPINAEALNLLPNSFLSVIKDNRQNGFALVNKFNRNFYLSYNETNKSTISENEFLDIWPGLVVIIDEDNKKNISTPKRNSTNRNILIAVISTLAIFFIYRNSIFPSIHFILSLVGLAICILILYHELGISSKMLSKFCSEDNKKTSCDAVLNSKRANLFGSFKLSDVGIIYFVSIILSWALLRNSNTNYSSIVLITLLAIPFTLFSIYYQYRIVKKWCLLCLSVVSVLWLQAISLLFSDFRFNQIYPDLNSILTAASCFLISFALWQFISPILKKEQELNTLKIEHFKFKRSYSIYKSLINNSEQINTNISDTNEIVFCNSKETPLLNIVIITNPLCGFCKEAHDLVEKLLKIENGSIKIIIRFNVKEESDSIDTKIALKLIEIYKTDREKCLEAMHDIYGILSPKDWLLKWGEPTEQKYTAVLSKTKFWCKQNNINFTPEILINGRSFPREYNRADLVYFIDDIIEEEIELVSIQTPTFSLESTI
ncbi:MAG: hypothetical protein EHM93_12940 [Bacteroidales bacterium]|nr:MAG: hypothetical protein EHM93_12940 [Bacteroidales bacterium]